MIVVGIVLLSAFFVWTHKRAADDKTPLLALEVVDSPQEWAAVLALFIIVGMEAAINFTVPLYIQIVQGRDALQTSVAMMPFMLTVFFTAILIVRLYDRFTPAADRPLRLRAGGRRGAVAGLRRAQRLERLPGHPRPDHRRPRAGGAGDAALQRAGHLVAQGAGGRRRARCAATQNLAAAVGTAVIGRAGGRRAERGRHEQRDGQPVITAEMKAEVDLDSINFLSNDRLKERFESTTSATPEQIAEAVRINAETRLRALKIGFFVLASMALLAIFPCGWLPDYRPGEVPGGQPKKA